MADTHIKIKPVTPRVQYTANGSTTVFPYSFAIFDETDMVVYVDDAIITTGYTVSGAGQTDGGEVTFDSAPVDGTIITLLRNVPIERITDFQEGGTFRPKNINDELDRQTAFAQQVQEALDRAVKVKPTSDIDPDVVTEQIQRVYDSIDNVDAVADDLTNIDAVAGNQTNIDAVAGNETNINAVNANKTNIDAVAGNETNINAVNANKTNIDNCATNMSAITDAPAQASAAAGSASDASNYAASSKQWAIGEPTEPPGGSAKYWAGQASTPVLTDNKSINQNASDELQTIGVINQNDTSTAIKTWVGTQVQYDKIGNDFYGWDVSGTTYYTTSATPAVNDKVYNSDKEYVGHKIISVGEGTIEFSTQRAITFIGGGYTQNFPYANDHLYINGIDLPTRSYDPFNYTWNDIPVGSTVTIGVENGEGDFDWIEIINSSNTNYIPNGLSSSSDLVTYTFIMPDENLSFGVYDRPD